ncbi:MAG: hypothetical protein Q9219_006852 [cf. Caloplaca sp. 3 TL-2023]
MSERDSSEEDYGEEILPEVDEEALATLPPGDQEGFRQMRERERRNTMARWRREGRALTELECSDAGDNARPLTRISSLAPQLPELQMDMTREALGSVLESGRRLSTTYQDDVVATSTQHTPAAASLSSGISSHRYTALNSENRGLDFMRFCGVGPVRPGLALFGHAPSPTERTWARNLAARNGIDNPMGQSRQRNASESPTVRPSRTLRQHISPVHYWQQEAREHGLQLSPPSIANPEQSAAQDRGKEQEIGLGRIKQMAKKVISTIKGLFRSRTEEAGVGQASRPATNVQLREEAQLVTTTIVTMTPVAATQRTQAQTLQESSPRPHPAWPAGLTGPNFPPQRTARAMMENYD